MQLKLFLGCSQFGCLGVLLPPGTFIMYQVLLQALNNRTRKTLFHLRVCKWEREPPQTSGSKEQSWGLSSDNAQSTPMPDTDEHLPCWATKLIQSTPSSFCILPEGRIATFQKRILTVCDPKTSLSGILYKVSESCLQTSGQSLSMKTWDIGNIE